MSTSEPGDSARVRRVAFTTPLDAVRYGAPDRAPRVVLWAVCALVAALMIWSCLGALDIVAVAEGKLIPATAVKIVQPSDGGIVREILVQDGDDVREGQVLIRLDATLNGADARSLAGEIALHRLTMRRIDAELAESSMLARPGDDPVLLAQVQAQALAHRQALADSIAQEARLRERAVHELQSARETLTKLVAALPIVQQQADAYDRLVKEGFYSAVAASDKKREAIERAQDVKAQRATVESLEATIAGEDKKIANLRSTNRSQLMVERTEALARLQKAEQEAMKQGFREAQLELRAPQAGVVKDLTTTTRGAVVQAGTVLLRIVPRTEPLVAEVQIRNEDIGFVQTGQVVKLKLAAFPFTKYGMLKGTVRTVDADSQESESRASGGDATRQAPNYKATIALDQQLLESQGKRFAIQAGMLVSAEIRQGERTVLEYLLSPVQTAVAQAARER